MEISEEAQKVKALLLHIPLLLLLHLSLWSSVDQLIVYEASPD